MDAKATYGLLAHLARFDTNQKCQNYLIQTRWEGKPQCHKCGNSHMNYYLAKRNIYKCSNCHTQFSVTQGTIFQRSKVPLTKWFLAIYLFTTKKRGVSSTQMAKWLGVKQHTAWYLLQRLREALKDENEIVLSGIVEADETFVGPKIERDTRLQQERKKHYAEQNEIHGLEKKVKRRIRGYAAKRGRKKGSTKEILEQKKLEQEAKGNRTPFEKNTIVFGMIEYKGRVVMKKLGHSRASICKENIYPHLKNQVARDSILITDQSVMYVDTANMFVEHLTVNHDIAYVIDGIHINNIENAWMHFKKMIDGTYFHLSRQHFDRYLNENTYRWNRRNDSELQIFESFFPLVSGKTLSYKKLITKEENKKAA